MSTAHESLSNVLFGQIRGGVLALLYGRADESFYVRQIARHLGASVGAVQRELEKLAQVGLITRKSSGNQVFYQVNDRNPVFSDMRSLVNKTVGVFNVVRATLEPLAERIFAAFVYGSVAREEENAQSDLDLMIVGDVELDEVLSRLAGVEGTLGRPANPTVYSAKEFKQKIASGNHFLNAVMNGKKIFLIGSENELRKVGGIRLAKTRAQQPK
ncbi:MAG TPA: nucleotidyltransferase domain-containing protein [Candidatus Angelobacter sp.]